MLIYLKKWTDLSQPPVLENRKCLYILRNGPIFVILWSFKIEMLIYPKNYTDLRQPLVFENKMLIYLKKWTNRSPPLLFENKNVDISLEMD